ncbi:hypothetical protein DSO57_1024102 [Entomophthora muscae]|uniref:Uncharacterized protein n=1 Tax=Entomophthora muscae TaxID=34485 RepID=A0ACC2SFG5_9FUNG|nr:hypothetical protein DSO57_1024102 [Entomophthora muscae]
MLPPARSVCKSRPVARYDWEYRADESLQALWAKATLHQYDSTLYDGLCRRLVSLPSPSTPGQPTSEDLASFANAIHKKASIFALDPHAGKQPLGRSASIPAKVQAETSQLGMFNNDASLKYARRRIRLANDFDHMLAKGFPNLSDQAHPEFTIYISLTPKVASLPSYRQSIQTLN